MVLLLIVGLVPRLIVVNAYPSHPVSDFYTLFHLALSFQNDLLARGDPYWGWRAPGLPLILGVLFRIIPSDPETIGRWTTALVSGITAVLPYLLWRGVFSLRARMIAGLLLALWPGQILSSGVLAQDTWILPPAVALAALATRTMAGGRAGNPIWAGTLFALGAAIRVEAVVLLLPVAIPAMLGSQKPRFMRNLVVGSLLPVAVFSALIMQRGLATGRYTLLTDHFGFTLLGGYVPGAGMGWADPTPYLNGVHPEVLAANQLNQQAARLVWQEIIRRPMYHVVRRVGGVFHNLFMMDKDIAGWALTVPDVMPDPYRADAARLASDMSPLLEWYPKMILALFIACGFCAVVERYRLRELTPILAVIGLAVLLHAAMVESPRFYVLVVGLGILMIGAVSDAKLEWPRMLLALVTGVLGLLLVLAFTMWAEDYVNKNDVLPKLRFHFTLKIPQAQVNCEMSRGYIDTYGGDSMVIRLRRPEPQPGEVARVDCGLESSAPQSYHLLLRDSYGGGPFPGRIEQIVYVAGHEIFRHDLAAVPWEGWMTVPLGRGIPGSQLSFTVEIRAVSPDPGWAWGSVAHRFHILIGE